MNPINLSCVIVFLVSIFAATKAALPPIVELNAKCGASRSDARAILQLQVLSTETGKCLMLCFLKELNMLDSNQKYDEGKGFQALRKFLSAYSNNTLKALNSAVVEFAKGMESKAGTCEYGYEIMTFLNARIISNQFSAPPPSFKA